MKKFLSTAVVAGVGIGALLGGAELAGAATSTDNPVTIAKQALAWTGALNKDIYNNPKVPGGSIPNAVRMANNTANSRAAKVTTPPVVGSYMTDGGKTWTGAFDTTNISKEAEVTVNVTCYTPATALTPAQVSAGDNGNGVYLQPNTGIQYVHSGTCPTGDTVIGGGVGVNDSESPASHVHD